MDTLHRATVRCSYALYGDLRFVVPGVPAPTRGLYLRHRWSRPRPGKALRPSVGQIRVIFAPRVEGLPLAAARRPLNHFVVDQRGAGTRRPPTRRCRRSIAITLPVRATSAFICPSRR